MADLIQVVDALLIDEHNRVLLIKRAKLPFMDKFVLPGGHVEPGEALAVAAARELEEEIEVSIASEDLEFLCQLDALDRDPRSGRRVSTVFWARVKSAVLEAARGASDAKSVHLLPLDSICTCEVGFDHFVAIESLRERIS